MGIFSRLFRKENPNNDTSKLPEVDWEKYQTAPPEELTTVTQQVSEKADIMEVQPFETPLSGDDFRQMYIDCSLKMHCKLTGSGTKTRQEVVAGIPLNTPVEIQYDEITEKYPVAYSGETIGYLPKSSGAKYRDLFEFESSFAFVADFDKDSKGNPIPIIGIFIPGSVNYFAKPNKKASRKKTKKSDVIELPASYVVIDTETTGLVANECEIIELSALKIVNQTPTERFSTLIKPTEKIPLSITEINGITNWMVRKSPSFEDVADQFLKFIGDSTLVGHNISFDDRFISVSLKRVGRHKLTNPTLDTLELSRRAWPRYKNHKLQYLAEKLDIKTKGAHRAMADCETTYQLLELIRDKLEK